MTNIPRGEQTVISRLRVGGAARDPVVARLRLEGMLGAAELRPRALPPSAVLCVRKLSAPPAALRLSRGGGAYASHAQDEWRRALADALDRVAARAARPISGPTPPGAEAVVFADRAELLACLALDWRAQSVAARWWWRGILRGADVSRAVVSEWLGSPEYVPAALEHLSRAGKAAEFAAALDVDAAAAMTQRVARAFALGGVVTALDATRTRDAHAGSSADESALRTRDSSGTEGRPGLARESAAAPPWHRFAAESRARSLDVEQSLLLGVGLTLARAPSHARSQAFARDVVEWLNGQGSDGAPFVSYGASAASSPAERDNESARATGGEFESAATAEASGTRALVEEGGPDAEGRARVAARGTGRAGRPRESETSPARRRVGSLHSSPYEEHDEEEEERFETPTPVEERRARERPRAPQSEPWSRTGSTDLRPSRTSAAPAVTHETSPPPHAPPLLEACVETNLGGLFYLINVGLFLELYGDFTTPLRPGLALPLWDFVALVGRRLCGVGFEDDAVWPLLARLAGRAEGEPPGLGFEPPPDWLTPPEWLRPFPEPGVWRWSADGGRLRVRHPEDFVLIDAAARGGDASLEARDATDGYAAFASFELRRVETRDAAGPTSPDESRAGARLEWWVETVTAYVRARLRRALGVEDSHALAPLLLERGARVAVSAARVEVLLQLARLPVEVRLSGLDRDPGWVPAAGRFVAFRYE